MIHQIFLKSFPYVNNQFENIVKEKSLFTRKDDRNFFHKKCVRDLVKKIK
jgi:hypothetical protein